MEWWLKFALFSVIECGWLAGKWTMSWELSCWENNRVGVGKSPKSHVWLPESISLSSHKTAVIYIYDYMINKGMGVANTDGEITRNVVTSSTRMGTWGQTPDVWCSQNGQFCHSYTQLIHPDGSLSEVIARSQSQLRNMVTPFAFP